MTGDGIWRIGSWLFFFLAGAFALSSAGRRDVPGRALPLMRALFPSWRFFEELVYLPSLYYRVGPAGGELGPWLPAVPGAGRRWSSAALNPEGNLAQACHSLVERLMSDVEDADPERADGIAGSVSYRLVESLVRRRIRSDHPPGRAERFQFKVDWVMQGDSGDRVEDALVSRVHGLDDGDTHDPPV